MSNQYEYSVDFSVIHPNVDPQVLTAALTELHPIIAARAGDDRRGIDGNPVIPLRKNTCSHWLASLHPGQRLFSGDRPLSEFLISWLNKFAKHKNLFKELDLDGKLAMSIAIYIENSNTADTFDHDLMSMCVDLKIDLEISIYFKK